jgi:prepilin-type N-terminal cleavage/methylation domain-containing protein/prepilin-type processing-associated H-X9-DG protein
MTKRWIGHAADPGRLANQPSSRSGPKLSRRLGETRHAFTLIELLIVIGIIALLIAIVMPALNQSKEMAKRLQCSTKLKSLQLALTIYAADHDEHFPTYSTPVRWPYVLQRNYVDLTTLVCPTDGPQPVSGGEDPSYPADTAPRSYIFNGWNDHYKVNFSPADYDAYRAGTILVCMRERYIRKPAETITFGEKLTDSGHFYMDLLSGPGNDVTEIEQSRHGAPGSNHRPGGSNYAYADGGVRFRAFGDALSPVNEWATTDVYRNSAVVMP